MNAVFLVVGVGILGIMLADFVLTTIGALARPVVSTHVARMAFFGIRSFYRRLPKGRTRRLSKALSGVLVMTSIASFWIVGFSIGWTLIYLSGNPSIYLQAAPTGTSPGFWDHWAHVGHLLSTLGGATTAPEGTSWNAVGVLVGVNGMVVLTLGMSFILATTQTVVSARAQARMTALDIEIGYSELITMVERLKASPFAAYYSEPSTSPDVPDYLYTLCTQDDADVPKLRGILRNLPKIETAPDGESHQEFLRRLSNWCADYMLDPPPDPGD